MALSDKNLVSLVAAEHIGPLETGDNIDAKKVAFYGYDTVNNVWRRVSVDANGLINSTATFTGTVTTAPTFALNPTAGTPTPAYGLIDADGDVQVDVLTSALPTGAATSAKQLPDNHNVTVTSAPTTAITAAALPLPAGAATAANQLIGLMPKVFDALTYTATSGTVDTYQYYTGGTGGSLVATLTVTFTASDHLTLTSVVRT